MLEYRAASAPDPGGKGCGAGSASRPNVPEGQRHRDKQAGSRSDSPGSHRALAHTDVRRCFPAAPDLDTVSAGFDSVAVDSGMAAADSGIAFAAGFAGEPPGPGQNACVAVARYAGQMRWPRADTRPGSQRQSPPDAFFPRWKSCSPLVLPAASHAFKKNQSPLELVERASIWSSSCALLSMICRS